MESFKTESVRQLFRENKYKITANDDGLVINNVGMSTKVWSILAVIVGVALTIFSMQSGSWKLGLLSIILIGIPFTSVQWRMPSSVTFFTKSNRILIDFLRGKNIFETSDRPELVVSYDARTSFVSPFQEGYQDHVYTFKLISKNKQRNLFRLESRKKLDDMVEGLVADISKLGIWKD